MTTLNTELYDALIAIKVPEKKARAAAQAIVDSNKDIADMKADLRWLKWIVLGFLIPLNIAIFLKLWIE